MVRHADILFVKHDSGIFRQTSNPVCGSWKSQASSPWAKQHRVAITVHKMSPLKSPLKVPLAKGVFKEVFLESLFPLQNQKWDPSTGKVPFSQNAKAIFKALF